MGLTFDAADAGTPADGWRDARAALPELDTGPLRRLLVVAAHPDDETLMAGGLIAHASDRGLPIDVVVATSGEASHPHSPTWTSEALAAAREAEVAAAVARLAPDARLHLLRIPDGTLAAHEAAIADALRPLIAPDTTVVSTWEHDRHPDHAAVARAVAAVAEGLIHLQAPIWLWHWGDDADVPAGARLDLTPAQTAAKREAIALHVTQVAALSPEPGDEVLMRPALLEHFLVGSEVFVPATAQPVDFDAMYDGADDPWGFGDRWYERRKRAILLASLPRERFGRALEIGSSGGVTTEAFARIADEVIATDVALRAVEQARERLRPFPHVRVELLRLPEEWPATWAPFDLIVLSEVGFYLGGASLGLTVDRCREALAPGGVFVACHWRPHVLGLDRGGDEVHRVIRERIGARRLVSHVEDDFVLEVFQADPAPSVAEATGLR